MRRTAMTRFLEVAIVVCWLGALILALEALRILL